MPTLVDKDFPDYTLYPVEEADEKWVKLSNPLPNTYYRVDNDTLEVKCMVTILEDGWHIACDSIGTIKHKNLVYANNIGWNL